ncbi:MAG: hypothetical protein ACRER5_12695, partial [Pseudomonas sp.]
MYDIAVCAFKRVNKAVSTDELTHVMEGWTLVSTPINTSRHRMGMFPYVTLYITLTIFGVAIAGICAMISAAWQIDNPWA